MRACDVSVCPGIGSINSQPIEVGVVPFDSEYYRKCPEQKQIEKRPQRHLAENENYKNFLPIRAPCCGIDWKTWMEAFLRKKLNIDRLTKETGQTKTAWFFQIFAQQPANYAASVESRPRVGATCATWWFNGETFFNIPFFNGDRKTC